MDAVVCRFGDHETTACPDPGCLRPGDPKVEQARNAARAWNDRSPSKELAAYGIRPLELTQHERRIGDGTTGFRGPTADTTLAGVTGTYVVGTTRESHDVDPKVFGQLSDKVLELQLRPQGVAQTTIRICGCQPIDCSGTSPVRPPLIQALWGPLPPNTTFFATPRQVQFPWHDVRLDYAQKTACPRFDCRLRK